MHTKLNESGEPNLSATVLSQQEIDDRLADDLLPVWFDLEEVRLGYNMLAEAAADSNDPGVIVYLPSMAIALNVYDILAKPRQEALVGAVYLDSGIDEARRLTAAIVAEPLERMLSGPPLGRDAKSELQERVQAAGQPSPRYRIVGTDGPDHNRQFIAVVEVGDEILGQGSGRSKKLAEQDAAKTALAMLNAAPNCPGGTGESS